MSDLKAKRPAFRRLSGLPSRQSARPTNPRLHQTACHLADSIEIESAQADGLKIKSASAAHSDASVNGFLCHATNAAGFGEAITKEADVS
jgi:hypothetical protein